jgi:RNase P subunit RPR2
MIRIARERISDLFVLADSEARAGRTHLATRYVTLARRIGTRYNVRLLPEYREVYCRGCSAYWMEGRTVRTRLRQGRRVRHCLVCGRDQRRVLKGHVRPEGQIETEQSPRAATAPALVGELEAPERDFEGEEPEEE